MAWSFGSDQPHENWEEADATDAADFYHVLCDEVAPLYYERDEEDLPRGWITIMTKAITSSLIRFSAHRMVAEYHEMGYAPLSEYP